MHKSRGFKKEVFHGDNEFNLNYLREHIRTKILNICAKLLHIPIIERALKIIKQVPLCTTHSVPYKRYRKLITRSPVECIIH